MKTSLVYPAILITFLNACASTGNQSAPQPVSAESEGAALTTPVNDYPTRDRVDYVLECVAKHGGLSYINQYACGCKIDKIAEQLNFADYEAARTFVQMQKTPGENGAPFRDPQQAKDLKAKIKEIEATAEKACFVK